MQSKFEKINDSFPPLWRQFLSAGTEWIDAYETLRNCRDENPLSTLAVWYVPPFAVSMGVECMVKALASIYDMDFNPKKYSHRTHEIIKKYSPVIPLFASVQENNSLINLIQEFEKTLDTKFGGTYVHMDGMEAEKLLDIATELREEVLRITGVHF